ncbi:T9SS type A sorting domain-containing protein [Dyadobacter sp. CY261]|uniref:T9SS type A sorting domain-containing protein n=1 Tax=Dyadobacter sp. CY261 TaxID=2907203 RepID=UPI001F280431|nr:T9SS type A sorting domain-containing protein [Dyadobacter sp. CY261]MCF0069770.1 T9SS type A sorting domain-containing protein [Dyadobacter sp. CY261]
MRIEKLNKDGSFSSLIQDYSDISRDNGGQGIFREDVSLQKGWYHILVKAVNSTGATVAINDLKAGVGNVFIIAGQSNAQGIKDGVLLPTDNAYDCVVSNNWLGECSWVTSPAPAYVPYPLFPVFSRLGNGNNIAPNGYNNWAYSRLGNLQVDATSAPIAFFNAAHGSTDINAWKTSSDGGAVTGMPFIGHPCSILSVPNNSGLPYIRLKQSLNYYASMFGSRGVLWHQGEAETEHKFGNPSYNSDYVNKLNYVIAKSRAQYGYNIPWFVSRDATLISKKNDATGVWTYGITEPTIKSNQNTVATTSPNLTGAITDGLNKDYRKPNDFVHLNDNATYKGLTSLANSWHSSLGSTGSGYAAQSLPAITMSYNSSNDSYTAYAPSGYVDYKWVTANGDLDRGVGSGSSGSSLLMGGAGVRCWVKNSTGNWMVTPMVYPQTCRSGARKAALESSETVPLEIVYGLRVFPNPSVGSIRVQFDLPKAGQVQLNIITQNGERLKKVADGYHDKGPFTYPIDVSSLQDGIYFCQLKIGDISLVKKIVVAK